MRRTKVELLGLVERVIELYEGEKRTIRQIEEILRSEGYDISRESIRKSIKKSRELAEVYKRSLDEAKVLLETVKNSPNTDVIEVTTSLLAHRIFEFVKSIDSIDFEDPGELVRALKRMADAQVKVAQMRLSYQKGFEEAREQFMGELLRELEAYPEVTAKIVEIAQRVRPDGGN